MAKVKKSDKQKAPKASAGSPPAQLLDLVENFLSDHSFDKAHEKFKQERARNGWQEDAEAAKKAGQGHSHSLVSVFQTWETSLKDSEGKASKIKSVTKVSSSSDSSDSSDSEDEGGDVDMKDAEAADESSSDSSSSSESSSESSDESDSDDEKPAKSAKGAKATAANPLKRKAQSDSESSSDESSDSDSSDESSSSSSEDERPQNKKQKVTADSDSESDSESSSDSSSESSDSDSDAEAEKAAKVPLPESGSDSDSGSSSSDSSGSDSSESEAESKKSKSKAGRAKSPLKNGSESSATLGKTSPETFPVSTFAPLPPDPTKTNNRGKAAKELRQQNEPFSRIRKDIRVDPRLSSNAFEDNAHGWGQKAHEDLIVTRGKGFTKEKNKKKRGSYKGGFIDTNARNGIKFD